MKLYNVLLHGYCAEEHDVMPLAAEADRGPGGGHPARPQAATVRSGKPGCATRLI